MHRRLSIVFLLLVLSAATAFAAETFGAFTNTTSSAANTFNAASDWTAPTAGASVAARTDGSTGAISPGGTYHVYAQVGDTGAPASGTTSVRADVSALTPGQTSAALVAGSFTFNGSSYTHRSAALTADAGLPDGTYAYTLTSTDAASNTRTQTGFTARVAQMPSLRAATSATTGTTMSSSSITVNAPAAQAGDTLFAFVVTNGTSSVITPPAGWSTYATQIDSGLTLAVFRRTAASEPTSYPFAWQGGTKAVATVVAYRNVGNSDQHAIAAEAGNVATHATPSLTTSVDARLVAVYADSLNSAARTWTSADTERADVATDGGGGTADVSMGVYDTTVLGAGTYQRTATSSLASANGAMLLLALKP